MKKQECSKSSSLFDNKGFTLIEMAIVLIIIGIIIGAIVKGKDIVKSAEQKKLYTKYVSAWSLIFNSYYDRTGWILGDTATDDNSGARDGNCDPTADDGNLNAQLTAVGLELPTVGANGNTTDRSYKDSNGVLHTLVLRFGYDSAQGNIIQITGTGGIPNDLGMALDRMIDGSMDGLLGDCLYSTTTPPAAVVPTAWPLATTGVAANSAIIIKMQF